MRAHSALVNRDMTFALTRVYVDNQRAVQDCLFMVEPLDTEQHVVPLGYLLYYVPNHMFLQCTFQ